MQAIRAEERAQEDMEELTAQAQVIEGMPEGAAKEATRAKLQREEEEVGKRVGVARNIVQGGGSKPPHETPVGESEAKRDAARIQQLEQRVVELSQDLEVPLLRDPVSPLTPLSE